MNLQLPWSKKEEILSQNIDSRIGNTNSSDSMKGFFSEASVRASSMVNDYGYPGYEFVLKPEVDFAKSYEYYKTVGRVQNVVDYIVSEIRARDYYFVDVDLEKKVNEEAKKTKDRRYKLHKQQLELQKSSFTFNSPKQDDEDKKKEMDISTMDSPAVEEVMKWAKDIKLKNLIEYIVRDLLIAGNCIIGTTDWKPVQIDSMVGLKRNEYGDVLEYVQQVRGRWMKLPLPVDKYIHIKYIDENRRPWGIGMFHSLTSQFSHNNKPSVPELEIYRRHVQNAAKIEEKYASPVVIWAYENIGEEQYKRQKKELEALQPGDRRITSRKPELITETIDGRSALIGTITPIIEQEVNSGLQSTANRLINEPSAMADAREANKKDDSRVLRVMDIVATAINEEMLTIVTKGRANIEFRWGSQDKFEIEMPQGLKDALAFRVVSVPEARDILASQGWKLNDDLFDMEQESNMLMAQQQMAMKNPQMFGKQEQGDEEDEESSKKKPVNGGKKKESVEPLTLQVSPSDIHVLAHAYGRNKERIAASIANLYAMSPTIAHEVVTYYFTKNNEYAHCTVHKEFNDCHDPETGQFCSVDGSGMINSKPPEMSPRLVPKVGNRYPKGRVGGSGSSAWNPIGDNKILKVYEPIELSDKPTAYHMSAGEDLASKFSGRITPEEAAEKIRQASYVSYDAIPVANKMSKDLGESAKEAEVEARVKGPVSAVGKLLRKPEKYHELSDLDDIVGMRMITRGPTALTDSRAAVESLRSKYDIVEIDDSVNNPRPDGYRAVHMTIKDKETGVKAEVQIKTQNQDRWSHWSWNNLYKNDRLPSDFRQVIENNKEVVNSYAVAMSEHYYRIDSGQPSQKPPCPEVIARTVGCL